MPSLASGEYYLNRVIGTLLIYNAGILGFF